MTKIFLGFILGTVVVFLLDLIILLIKTDRRYQRHCLNCVHAIPSTAQNGKIKLYCDLTPTKVDNYPVQESNYCGRFDFTEELKAEHVRCKAEKLIKR